MANYSNLSATINAQIRANGVQAITGPVLNAVLTAMVNVLGDGCRLNGVAVPADNPGSPDNRVAYLAAQDGTYTNFGGLTISGEVALLLWDSAWTKAPLFSIDTAVTPGSGNLVTSGAVDSALTTLANNIAAAYMQLVPAATEGNLAEFDNAGQVRDAGVATADIATKDGAFPNLFAGYAGNLVDTRSAGTPQGPYAFRQSGGDGVDYMVRIKGRTEAFNQLVGPSDTQVTIPSGHLYYAIINGTASVGTSDGTPISVTGGTDIVVDLTLEGLGLTTADQFRALHPLGYYNPMSKLINNAATGLESVGFNQWDEEWEQGSISPTGGNASSSIQIRSKNYVPVFPSTQYYFYSGSAVIGRVCYYDVNKNFVSVAYPTENTIITTPAGAYFMRFIMGNGTPAVTTYNHDICINRSDASRNGIYEPYWKREIVLGLTGVTGIPEGGSEADRVTIFPNGPAGVGTAQDMFYEENGVAKAKKKRARVDLGTLVAGDWTKQSTGNFITNKFNSVMKGASANTEKGNLLSNKLVNSVWNTAGTNSEMAVSVTSNFFVGASGVDSIPELVNFLQGVMLDYELATPIVYTDLQNADGTPFVFPKMIEVDNLGTEKRLPEDTAADPQGGFESDSNYSVSTANLVRLLNL